MNPGALPRAACECAPLALNTYKSSASRYNRINVLLELVTRKHDVCGLAWIIARQVNALRRMRFPLFDDRRNHRSIFDHNLHLRLVIKAAPDLRAVWPLQDRATLRGTSTRRRSYSSAIQLAAVRR